jgi:hypothetical protein
MTRGTYEWYFDYFRVFSNIINNFKLLNFFYLKGFVICIPNSSIYKMNLDAYQLGQLVQVGLGWNFTVPNRVLFL